MTDPRDPYSIEPEHSDSPPAPKTATPSSPGRAHIEAPKLLEDFDEDADFDRDPELERAITGGDREPRKLDRGDFLDTRPEFGSALFGNPLYWAIAGGVLLVAAMIAAGVNAPNRTVYRVALTFYNAVLHTGTGIVAVFLAAYFTEMRVKQVELTAARMFAAVAAFVFVFNLNINFFGPDYRSWRLEELALAAVAYVGIVAASFKLTRWQPLAILIGSHFVLWLIVQVGMALAAAVASAPTAAPVAPAP